MIGTLANILVPIAMMAGLGFYLTRTKRVDQNTLAVLCLDVAVPCLVFRGISANAGQLIAATRVALVTQVSLLLLALLFFIVLRIMALPWRELLPPLVLPNAGNIGLPVAALAFGDTMLGISTTVFVVVSLSQVTIGQTVYAGRMRVGAVVRSPVVIAALLGVAMAVADLRLPDPVDGALKIVAGMAVPLMLMMLGRSLANLSAGWDRSLPLLILLRLVSGAAICGALGIAVNLDRMDIAVVTLMMSMPAAAMTYAYAQRFGTDTQRIGTLIAGSTAVSVLTIPVMLVLLEHFGLR